MMKKRQRTNIPTEVDSNGKPNKRQKKIILNTDNLTSPSSVIDHSAKSDDKYSNNHKHLHKHSHNSHSSHGSQSGHSSDNENEDSSNGEKKEKIIIQIKNTNVKKKKEKLIIQIKNDKRKKSSASAPNSASINSDVQNDFESNKKQISPKKEKKILILSPVLDKTEKEKNKKEKKSNDDNKNDSNKELNSKSKKKYSDNKKDNSVESKKEAILKIINNSATSNKLESQEGKRKNNSFSKQHDKKNIEGDEISPSQAKKDVSYKDSEIEHEKQKPRGRPPKSGKKKVKKESVENKIVDDDKTDSKVDENNDIEQSVVVDQKETPTNVNSLPTADNSEKILQDKEIKAEPETEVKKHRGRPKKSRNSNSFHHLNPRSHSTLAQRRHEEEEMTEEMILEEEISDPKGDEKN